MKTLLVEDDAPLRLLFGKQISALGHEVQSCSTAQEALTMSQEEAFNLFVLDLGLPDMDGIELCRRLRSMPSGRFAMVLIITGRDLPGDLEDVLDAGADDFLAKPIYFEQLKVRLSIMEQRFQQLLQRQQAENALQQGFRMVQRAKKEWESTADALSHVVCLLDSRQHVIRANRAIETWGLGQVTTLNDTDVHHLFHPNCQLKKCLFNEFLQIGWEKLPQKISSDKEIFDAPLARWLKLQLRPILVESAINERETFAVFILEDITSYKQIQDALIKQDRLLLGVAGALEHLIVVAEFETAIIQALKTLAFSADVDRIYIFENHLHPETEELLMSQRFEWDRFTASPQTNHPNFQNISYRSTGLQRWYDTLTTGLTISGLYRELPPEEQAFLAPQNIMAILLVPIFIGERFWGFIGFEDCHQQRQWRGEEEAVLMALAAGLGEALARETMEQQLRQTSSDLRAIFQSLPDEYFRLAADGSVLDYNIAQGEDMYLSSETFMGKWASGLLPEKVEQQFEQAMAKVRKSKKLMAIEYAFPMPDKQKHYEEIRLLPFLDDQLLVVARDITERKLAEEELRKHRDHLEELVQERTTKLRAANQLLQQEVQRRKQTEEALRELNQQLEVASQHKSQFLSRMSHELRTPLNAMIGYTALTLNALRDSLSPKHLDHLTKAEQSAKSLLHLINDVLDFSKIEAGHIEVLLEEIDLTEIIEDVAVVAEGLLLNKTVEFKKEIAPDLPQIQSDYTKVKQILNNLVGNAIKFTTQGQVTLRAHQEAQNASIRVEVADTGSGIPPEKLSRIFEPFKQADATISKQYGGTGLGLAISKRFCEMLGIEIGVNSEPGKGSLFWLHLPCIAVAQAERAQTPQQETAALSAENLRSILLVDDDQMTLEVMEDALTTTGYTVYTGKSGREGLELALANTPDIIIMDLLMDDMDGFEATRRLKTHDRTKAIPVIACSAVATTEFQQKARESGCIGYMTKPIHPDQLVEQITRSLQAT
ncbi:multi-sensor hybrid histidine kinase [Candidatus Moduliflexus flocculans]|uniref:histidine kinase n=1 Tax=Candidatus Moduliflexus flocculans TaxID=1499966 RepID=A0A0S6VSK5_9BACT|nr:multi-sensor hybrid histidine kinase [Candidatus Moduliflexus flocculans]